MIIIMGIIDGFKAGEYRRRLSSASAFLTPQPSALSPQSGGC
jgi:hypothetical protein